MILQIIKKFKYVIQLNPGGSWILRMKKTENTNIKKEIKILISYYSWISTLNCDLNRRARLTSYVIDIQTKVYDVKKRKFQNNDFSPLNLAIGTKQNNNNNKKSHTSSYLNIFLKAQLPQKISVSKSVFQQTLWNKRAFKATGDRLKSFFTSLPYQFARNTLIMFCDLQWRASEYSESFSRE